MCGFVGEFLTRVGVKPPDPDRLAVMGETLRHRGPDGSGQVVSDYFGLHHRRLAIIDLVSGAQPLTSPSGNTVVVYNGEIYNFPELRELLRGRGHTFRTETDTEVLVHGYQEWGLDLPSRLRGMFAFALVDKANGRLLLARDRLGQKPLYICQTAERIFFASEPKALLGHPLISREVDPGALLEALIFRYVPDPHCIFSGMVKLPPGYLLVADREGNVQNQKYWDLDFASDGEQRPAEYSGQILPLLDEAVTARLVADVPLGAFLSGGLDSAALVASMRQQREDVLAVSVGFDQAGFDERPAARACASRLGVQLVEHVTKPDAVTDLDILAKHFDEPFFDSSALPTLHVCREARKHVTVALSGDGGDEAFAGYRRYRFDWWENRTRRFLPAMVRRSLCLGLGRLWSRSPRLPRWLRAGATLENLGRDPFNAYIRSVSSLLPEEAFAMLAPALREQLGEYDPLDLHRGHFRAAGPVDSLSRVQYLDFKTYLPGDILVKVDRASMAVSLEARAPLLDHHFLAAAARVPPAYRIRGTMGKWILRRALADRLGPESLIRNKQGFSIPMATWLRENLRKEVMVALEGDVANTLLHRPLLNRWAAEHQANIRDRSEGLWALLVLDRWWRNWGEGTP